MEMNKMMLFTIWTTTACNLRCKYCYEGDEKAINPMSITTAEETIRFIRKIMNEHPKHDVMIVFHGGEPCMNFSIIEFVTERIRKELPECSVSFGMTTNATLLNEQKIDFLSKNMKEITISIDGTKCTHDHERVDCLNKGSFNQALAAALLLSVKKPEIRIRMTVTPYNVVSLFSNIRFLIDCGFKTIVPCVDFFSKNWNQSLFEILEEQLLLTKQYIKMVDDEELAVAMTEVDEMKEVGECAGAVNGFNIYPDGNIYPCVYTVSKPQYVCGNVKTGLYKEKIKQFKEIYKQKVMQCEGCSYYKGCFSTRCKFLNEALSGDLYTPSPSVCLTQNACISVYHHV